ncbi:hypothetical protein [Gordonia aichiensis]|uniref:Mce-associated membrane protein n=1 Tax=Gordonia aichiensis NBRC 108223 TaxID=1220583 RepID=L7KHM9_9ACTN|nr:hypothetical protein [Gordonia aichiensis]GAC47223.1 hypothetical protein GOACH_03_02410 [Gordonia aichiensis NBRC 108223]
MSSIPTRTRANEIRGQQVVGIRRALVLLVCAAVVLAAVAAGVVLASRAVVHNSAVDRARGEVRAQAGQTVAAIFTVHSATWRSERARARELVAGDFATSFAAQLERGPTDGVTAVEWRPNDVAVSGGDADNATVLMTATVTTLRAGAEPETEKRTVSASFVDSDGRWLVTGVEVLA